MSSNAPVRSSTMHLQHWKYSKLYPWSWSSGPTAYSKIDRSQNFFEDLKICCKYTAHSCASAVCRINSSCSERDSEFAGKKRKYYSVISMYSTCIHTDWKLPYLSWKTLSLVPLKHRWSSLTTRNDSQSSNGLKHYANDMTLVILYVGFHVAAGSVCQGNAQQHTSCPAVRCQGDCG